MYSTVLTLLLVLVALQPIFGQLVERNESTENIVDGMVRFVNFRDIFQLGTFDIAMNITRNETEIMDDIQFSPKIPVLFIKSNTTNSNNKPAMSNLIILDLIFFLIIALSSMVAFHYLDFSLVFDKDKKPAQCQAKNLINRITKSDKNFKIKPSNLTNKELVIASHLIVPEDITTTWNDIAGLDEIVQELRENIVLPVRHRNLRSISKMWKAPSGVLLHGPPGCGKTLTAKATAKEAGMRFINLDISTLTDKYYGETGKLAAAVFSLAKKLEPCIIFIDEIDSFLGARNSNDFEATSQLKTQFMMLWDGLTTSNESTIIVMGATNRPKVLDHAILRRMPLQFSIKLPDTDQRKKILDLMLKTEITGDDVDLNRLAELAVDFSGSDLKEVCRDASVCRLKEYIQSEMSEKLLQHGDNGDNDDEDTLGKSPPILMKHLIKAYEKVKGSKIETGVTDDVSVELEGMYC